MLCLYSGEASICSSNSCHLKKSNIFIVQVLFLFFNITDKWEQSVLIVDEANDISYCVGNKGKNHAARFRSPNGLVIIPALPKFSDTLTLSQSGGAEKFFVITPL